MRRPRSRGGLAARLSIQRALIGVMLVVSAAAIGAVATVGVISIQSSVVREAQERVNRELDTVLSLYEDRFARLAEHFEGRLGQLGPGEVGPEAAARLALARRELGFAVLNLCDPEGRPLAGAYPEPEVRVPVSEDPVLRQALSGEPARGTVALGPERLLREGGRPLAALVGVRPAHGASGGTSSALFMWLARPVLDEGGRVVALVYGGLLLNHDQELVDSFRDTAFGAGLHEGRPVGTVTFFLDRVRVATNVVHADGRRAVGTEVSDEVAAAVLEGGRRWQDRALVVDAWYLAAYEPVRDPDGRRVGMVYVGLLEAPYAELRSRLVVGFLAPVVAVLVLGLLVVALIVRQITRPLGRLQDRAERIAGGDWQSEPVPERTYREIAELGESFGRMQAAVRDRDRRLREKNETLGRTNELLESVNSNYMKSLSFVTHELKSPLAAMQGHIDLMVEGLAGEVPEQARHLLVRLKRNCEELQDMVKNYLDLSRAERGEMAAELRPMDLVSEVVRPCVEQNAPLFASRRIRLETAAPDELRLTADPELLRVVLTNYLSNAAKYGAEGGRARLEVGSAEGGAATVSVWNEGEGFTPEESGQLFRKFSRLRNSTTSGKRGSGLGLWLCELAVGLHGGRVAAEAEAGRWARFSFEVPIEPGSRASG